MTAAKKLDLVSVEQYLANELTSPVKHEYVGGVVQAMAGAKTLHNRIVSRIMGALFSRLRGKPCEAFGSDMKVRVVMATHERFYYPDAFVVCDRNSDDSPYQDQPIVIFEVLSKKTQRIDKGEKKDAYLSIPSLKVYVLVEQETIGVVVYRRTTQGFAREVLETRDAILRLPELALEVPLSEFYAGLEPAPEPEEE